MRHAPPPHVVGSWRICWSGCILRGQGPWVVLMGKAPSRATSPGFGLLVCHGEGVVPAPCWAGIEWTGCGGGKPCCPPGALAEGVRASRGPCFRLGNCSLSAQISARLPQTM